MIHIRAFRAVDNEELCGKFIDGHRRVLSSIGINEVTSSTDDWKYNPSSYVIIVESPEGKTYGGARVQVADGITPLPIEMATGYMDNKIYDIVKKNTPEGTGEVCGLWNSREVAGLGIGSIFLTRSAVTIASLLKLKTLFALCASYTVSMAEQVGYEVERSIGNEGDFYYPKSGFIATAMYLPDVGALSKANSLERERIFDLRNNPAQTFTEKGKRNDVEIHYNLSLIPSHVQ